MFARLAASALLAGASAGLIAGLLQLAFVQPVLLHAELYETGALVPFGGGGGGGAAVRPELPGVQPVRDGLSLLFAVLVHTGYAFVLVAAMAAAERRGVAVTARRGLLWGIAGFVAVQLAPAFSLPPEVPGLAAADLALRQLWWAATVASAAAAVGLIAFGRGLAWAGAAILLLAPHLVGAPQPDAFAGTVPPELAALFAARSLGVGAAAWALLGVLAAVVWRREAVAAAPVAQAVTARSRPRGRTSP